MVNWIGLITPFAYIGILVGSLATFSSLYRKRKAGKHPSTLVSKTPKITPQELTNSPPSQIGNPGAMVPSPSPTQHLPLPPTPRARTRQRQTPHGPRQRPKSRPPPTRYGRHPPYSLNPKPEARAIYTFTARQCRRRFMAAFPKSGKRNRS